MRLISVFLTVLISGCASLKSTERSPSNANSGVRVDGSSFKTAAGAPFYVHGVNLPWLDGHFGSYLAPSLAHPEWGVQYNHDVMLKRMTQIKSLNVNVVRLFLSGDLQGYQLDAAGNFTGLDPVFFKNLDDTLDIAQTLSLKVYLVVLEGMNGHPDMQRYERPIFVDATKQKQFVETIVRPLARRYAGNPTIFAFDVLNESNAEVNGGITWGNVTTLIKNTASMIHSEDPTRLVSCSLIKANAKNMGVLNDKYSQLGLDFYDLHQYSDAPDLPRPQDYKIQKPIVLGEFGQTEGQGQVQQAKSAQLFLSQARERGWNGALIWAFDFPNSPKQHRLMNSDGSYRPAAQAIKDFAATLQSP